MFLLTTQKIESTLTAYERIYIQFKGRVLGPLQHERVLELVSRGQITPEQPMSSDGVTWKTASDFHVYFPAATKEASAAPGNSAAPTPEAESWYIHFDGQPPQAYDDATIKQWVAQGTINRETLIWKPDIETWKPAGELRPQWFSSIAPEVKPGMFGSRMQGTNPAPSSGPGAETTWSTLAATFVSTKPWMQLVAIIGLLLSSLIALGTMVGFMFLGVSDRTLVIKLCLFIAMFVQTLPALFGVFVFLKLLKTSAAMAAFQYRSEPAEIGQVIRDLDAFWKFAAILSLSWVIALAISGFLTALAQNIGPPADEYSMLGESMIQPLTAVRPNR